MNERGLMIGLLAVSVINTCLLVVLAICLLRFMSVLAGLGDRLQSVLTQVERELAVTGDAFRTTIGQFGLSLKKGVELAERYIALSAWRRMTGGNRWAQLLAGASFGYGAAKSAREWFENRS